MEAKVMMNAFTPNYNLIVLMPPSALDTLSRLNVSYPMMFEVASDETGAATHCGVLEFSSPEGVIYLPNWVFKSFV